MLETLLTSEVINQEGGGPLDETSTIGARQAVIILNPTKYTVKEEKDDDEIEEIESAPVEIEFEISGFEPIFDINPIRNRHYFDTIRHELDTNSTLIRHSIHSLV